MSTGKMLWSLVVALLFIHATTICISLPQVSSDVNSIPSMSPDLSSFSNPSILTFNSSLTSGKKLKIGCDAGRYGRNLKVKSCRDLLRLLSHEDEQYKFAERDSGIPYDIPLPLRTYSSE